MQHYKLKIFEYILHGGSVKFCRLCFSTLSDDDFAYHSEDEIYIKSEYFSDTLLLKRVLESLLSYKIDLKLTSQLICRNCVDELIKCFIFSKKCQKIENTWKHSLSLLEANVKHHYNNLKNSPIVDKIYIKLKKVKKKVKSEKNESNKTKKYNTDAYSDDGIKPVVVNQIKTCENCKKTFRHKCSYIRHVKLYCGTKTSAEKNNGTNVKCFVCNGYYKHRDSLLKHLKSICLKDNPVALKNYLNNKSNDGLRYMCEFCGKRLRTKKGYSEHIAACSVKTTKICKSEQFICDTCNAIFYVKRSMVNHWQNKHVEKSVPCHVCGKLFKTKNKIHAHMIVHTRERNHKCDTCNKFFVTKHALIYHTRLHTGDRPYPCSLCEEKFLSASRRMDHMRKKHWEPTFKCRICYRFCTTKYSLKVHEMRHYKPNAQLKKFNNEEKIQ